MGLIYSFAVFGRLVAKNPGLTREELFELNAKTYRAKFDVYFDEIDPSKDPENIFSHQLIECMEGRYYIKEGKSVEGTMWDKMLTNIETKRREVDKKKSEL